MQRVEGGREKGRERDKQWSHLKCYSNSLRDSLMDKNTGPAFCGVGLNTYLNTFIHHVCIVQEQALRPIGFNICKREPRGCYNCVSNLKQHLITVRANGVASR